MHRLIVPAVFLLALLPSFSRAQLFDWAVTGSAPVGSWGKDVAVDQLGNVYVTGFFNGTCAFGTVSCTSVSGMDGFLAKYDAAGTALWVLHMKGTGTSDEPSSVAVDAAGNVYAVGCFFESMTVGSTTLTSTGKNDVFVLKCNPAGDVLWAVQGGGAEWDDGEAVCVAPDGSVYIGGYFFGSSAFGTVQLAGAHDYDAYIVKLDANGVAQWGRVGAGSHHVFDLCTDAAGSVYATGSCDWPVNFGSLTSADLGMYLVKFNPAGTEQWLRSIACDLSAGNGVACDAAGNVFVTGSFSKHASFGSISLSDPGAMGMMFLAKYSPAGDVLVAKGGVLNGASSFTYGQKVAVDAAGNAFVIGMFQGRVWLDAFHSLSNAPGQRIFLAKYDNAGVLSWVTRSYGSGFDFAHGVAADAAGNAYITGRYAFTCSYGGYALVNPGTTENMVTAKMSGTASEITGTIFYDLNNNGMPDPPLESPAADALVRMDPAGSFAMADVNGVYRAFASTGAHTVLLPVPPLYHILNPSSHTVVIAGSGQIAAGRNFALVPVPNMNDLRIDFIPFSPPRPGYPVEYHLRYRNVGTTTLSGEVKLVSDALLTYRPASSIPPENAQAGTTLRWTFTNLAPGQSRDITHIMFDVPQNAALGTPVTMQASIEPLAGDQTPGDNKAVAHQTVANSFDPNAKEVTPAGEITTEQVAQGQWLEYTIHFENVGSAEAVNVRVEDQLSQLLDPATFEIVASSDAPTLVTLTGGLLVARFDGIRLAPPSTGSTANQGFLSYRIKALGSIGAGQTIENSASIFFDFNAPIITNTTMTRVSLPAAGVALQALSGSSYCAGAALPVLFTTTGAFDTTNMFSAELSDTTGGFSQPLVIGTAAGTTGGTINAVIPAGTVPSTQYRVRVTASSPVLASAPSAALAINAIPVVTLAPFADVPVNAAPFVLAGGMPLGGTYSGAGVSGNVFDPAAAGMGVHAITYTFTGGNGCSAVAAQTIRVVAATGISRAPDLTDDVTFAGNYPNPFTDRTVILIAVRDRASLRLTVHEMTGRLVAVLLDGDIGPGLHNIPFDSCGLPAGVYLCRLEHGGRMQVLRVQRGSGS